MRLPSAASGRGAAALGLLALSACASAPQTAAHAPVNLDACTRNVQNAVGDSWFMCSLASASLAHEEAGREAIGNADCLASPESCAAPDSTLIVRVLFSPPATSRGPPRASSIELSGFDRKQAHADMRELAGPEDWYTRTQMAAVYQRPPMKPGASGAFDLSEQATADILKLAHDLRLKPEQHSWTLCTVNQPGPNDQVIMMGDAAGIFIQLFFGGEEHAYLRNSMYLGHAGDIAALLFGDPRNTEGCVPDKRL